MYNLGCGKERWDCNIAQVLYSWERIVKIPSCINSFNGGFYCSLFEYILLESLLKVVNLKGPDWQSNTSNGVLHGIYL